MPDCYVYSINQSANGLLWIGTGSGLTRFDGFDFYKVTFPDSVSNRYVSVSFRDSKDNLWFGCSDGALFYLKDNELVKVQGIDIQTVNDIIQGDENHIFVIPQEKMLLKIDVNDPGKITKYYIPSNIITTSGCFTEADKLLLGTQENLLYCNLTTDSVKVQEILPGIEYSRVQVIKKSGVDGIYLAGTEGQGLFRVMFRNGRPVINRYEGLPGAESVDVKSILVDQQKKVWISNYGVGILQFDLDNNGELSGKVMTYSRESGLAADNVRSLFQDSEGNKWVGYYDEKVGLSMLRSGALSFYAPGEKPEDNNIIFVTEYQGKYLVGTVNGFSFFDLATGKYESPVNMTRFTGGLEIAFYMVDPERNILMGTKGGGIYLRRPGGATTVFYRSGNSAEDYIRHISRDGNKLWLSTLNGIVVIDRFSGTVKARYDMESRLPHNSINQIFIQKDGRAVIGTECDRLYRITINGVVEVGDEIMVGASKNKILCFAEDSYGTLWAGTAGNGVFSLSGDSLGRISTTNGLFSNYCYSIFVDSKNQVWIGHERGISKYDPSTGTVKVISTDFARGGNCNQNAIYESASGLVMIGTSEGLIVYDRTRDVRKTNAPVNNIVRVMVNDREQPLKSSYTLPYGKYTIKIDYVGISFSDPEKVYYSTKLDNWNDNWSPLKLDRQETYHLRDGKYTFNLISVNEDGLQQDQPLVVDFLIKKPFWRTWWFVLAIVLVSGTVISIVVYERDKAQKKIKKYLEEELAARTSLVRKQKEALEIQNIEITDSINYAKRIQSSILPDLGKLKETFPDAFILFHPRDIVSGDFYWFDKVSDEKFMLVCADSTGHGVPGAFMSMIGSALLQDIISRKGITKPSEVLTLLDKQIFSTLNQNVDVGISNDGMDMVVCEINPKTRHIRFASAMRPVVLVMEGDPYYIKGNRCSVGGEAVIEKFYDDQEYYLSEGDTIYMFSDGLPDQFGGVDGKKMKIARLKKLLEDVSRLPMEDQKEAISTFFFEWKGDFEQVDDILVMGVMV
ncbi:MAG: SpoIIE family protein phosphatase [Bacteroidales bacterium]